jgi:hypothetical protein
MMRKKLDKMLKINNYLYMNNLKSLLCSLVISERDFFLFFYRCTASRLFFVDVNLTQTVSPKKQEWLAMQSKIDSIKALNSEYIVKVYPFNPNFITDYKGYKLGMSVQEIDRLLEYRKGNKYVNSQKNFKQLHKFLILY